MEIEELDFIVLSLFSSFRTVGEWIIKSTNTKSQLDGSVSRRIKLFRVLIFECIAEESKKNILKI